MCAPVSLSLSLFTFAKTVWIQFRLHWNSRKNISSIKKCVHAIESMQADAHHKMGFQYIILPVPCSDPEGGTGGPPLPPPSPPPPPPLPPLKNHKNIDFLSNTGQDPLKFSKLPSQHSMLGHHRPASKTPLTHQPNAI